MSERHEHPRLEARKRPGEDRARLPPLGRAAGKGVARQDLARRAAGRQHDRDRSRHERPGELQVRRRRVPSAGSGNHQAGRVAGDGGRVVEHDGQHRHRQRSRSGRARQADGPARALERDAGIGHLAEPPRIRALERVEVVRVRLPDVIGGMDLAGHRNDDALGRQRRIGRGNDGLAQVRRPVVALLRCGSHRADDHHRLGRQRQEVPRECGLLDHVGPLHHHGAVDVRARQLARKDPADLEHLRERQVRRGHEAPVDRLDVGQLCQPRHGGEQIVPAKRRHVPAAG